MGTWGEQAKAKSPPMPWSEYCHKLLALTEFLTSLPLQLVSTELPPSSKRTVKQAVSAARQAYS